MSHHTPSSLSPCTDPLERLARKRAKAKLGWFLHAVVFLSVNLLIWVLASAAGRHGALFPTLGWGLGLTLHGLVVLSRTAGWYERLVQAERTRLQHPGSTPSAH